MARPNTQPVDDDLLNPKISASCLDFLLIELVPLVQRVTEQLHAREQALHQHQPAVEAPNETDNKENIQQNERTTTSKPPVVAAAPGSVGGDRASSVTGSGTVSGTVSGFDPHLHSPPDSMRGAVHWRLDKLGYRVGQGLAERFSVNKARATSPLDAIKFVCKDVRPPLFRKPIDNLKTNHRGVFVLTDQRFPPLSRVSRDRRAGPRGAEDTMRRAQTVLVFPCGVIRGALAALGVEVIITGDTTEIPTATFQIKLKGVKS